MHQVLKLETSKQVYSTLRPFSSSNSSRSYVIQAGDAGEKRFLNQKQEATLRNLPDLEEIPKLHFGHYLSDVLWEDGGLSGVAVKPCRRALKPSRDTPGASPQR
jgi:hypothetical protein